METYKKTLTEIYALYDKKIEELSLIRRIGDSIRTPLDLETLCVNIIETVVREISVDYLALLLVDLDQCSLVLRVSYDAGQDETRFYPGETSRNWPLKEGLLGRAAQRGEPVILAGASPDPDFLDMDGGRAVSLLLLPLMARHQTVGLFRLSRSETQPFGPDEARILAILADQAAIALANVQLVDELTETNVRLRESERQAHQTSLYLESLLEAANDVIFTLDEQGMITYVNRKAGEWGYAKEDLIGRPFEALMMDSERSARLIGRLAKQAGEVLEVGLRTAAGEPRDVLLSTSHISKEDGPGQGAAAYLLLARDITQRKQLEKQLFHSEKLASIGILAAGVAHEIGNPLSAISGYTQILQSGASPEETLEYLEAIEDQTRRIGRIIEDLLNFSRPSAGLRSEIQLSEALPQVMSMLSSQRAFKKMTVEYDLAADVPPVSLDRDNLAQIIINIALNAAQAMPEGGRLTISLDRQDDLVRIRLADTGPGIPPEIQSRIFDPFFTTKPAGQGTGLGLAICHRIVESYRGSISVNSRPGLGTTFTVLLPAAGA
ncbi:MAG: ATP-binding protein [Thermodesulfobacteriota bacterium]